MKIVVLAELGHAVVLLLGAVVPQALAVVPLCWSGTTVASGQAQLLER